MPEDVEASTSSGSEEPTEVEAEPPGTEPGTEAATNEKKKRPLWVEIPLLIVLSFIVALFLKTFLVQAFYIPSESMETTLDVGDRVLVEKLSYRFHDPRRGDVVVFEKDFIGISRPPEDDGGFFADIADGVKGLFGFPTEGTQDFIKRVIAVEGDMVEGREGKVFIDGEAIDEPYLDEGITTSSFGPTLIPEGFLFVMGDNRGNSDDSRSFGPVPVDKVIGHAFVIVWSPSHIGGL